MHEPERNPFSLSTLALTVLAVGASTAAQDDLLRTEPVNPDIEVRPEIEKTVDSLEEHWTLRDGEDSRARERALTMLVRYADDPLNPEDAERLLLTFQQVIDRVVDDLPERHVAARAAIRGLSRLGRPGIDALLDLREEEGLPIRPETQGLRGLVIRKIARSGHESGPEVVREAIERSSERGILTAAGAAIPAFRHRPRDVREPLVESMARRLAGLENVTARAPGDPARYRDLVREDAEDDLRAVFETWKKGLASLTGVNQPNGQEWWDWYQEHGDDDWPADAAAREWRKEHAADGGAAGGR